MIEFDVDDRATYETLESDLKDGFAMRSPPQWKTNIRSGEKPSAHIGYAAVGLSDLARGMNQMFVAAIASIIAAGVVALYAWSSSPAFSTTGRSET